MLANNATLVFQSQFSDAEKTEIEKLAPEISRRLSAMVSRQMQDEGVCGAKLKKHGMYWVYIIEEARDVCCLGMEDCCHYLVVFNEDSEHTRLFGNLPCSA